MYRVISVTELIFLINSLQECKEQLPDSEELLEETVQCLSEILDSEEVQLDV